MSGPKVVRIVSRQEILAICSRHIAAVDAEIQNWTAFCERNGGAENGALARFTAQREALRRQLDGGDYLPLQKGAPILVDAIRYDLDQRMEAIVSGEARRKAEARRLPQTAAAALAALTQKGIVPSAQIREGLDAAARGETTEAAKSSVAQAMLLAIDPAQSQTSGTAHALSVELGKSERREILQDRLGGKAFEPAVDPREKEFAIIERHLAEIAAFGPLSAAEPLQQRYLALVSETNRRAIPLLLDALVIDVGRERDHRRQLSACRREIEGLEAQIEAGNATYRKSVLASLASLKASEDLPAIGGALASVRGYVAEQDKRVQSIAQQELLLSSLASLGYEVRMGMSTQWSEAGRIVLRKPSTPGYGLEVGGRPDGGPLQMRVVSFNGARDTVRDKDAEVLWCGDMPKLQGFLASSGVDLAIEQATEPGVVPMKLSTAISAPSEQSGGQVRGTTLDRR